MFNSVDFVLMFLSMFSLVTKEGVRAVTLLLQLAFQYNLPSVKFDMYEITASTLEPLSALAESCGYDVKKISKKKLSKMEAHELLHAILEPVLGRLSPAELEGISKTRSSGGEVLTLPLDKVRTLVKMWTQNARNDEENRERFETLPALRSIGYTSTSTLADTNGTFTNDDPGPWPRSDEAVKHEVDRAPKNEKLRRWSRMEMDAKTAAIILAYCNEYAAVPAKTRLRRHGRVSKRQINPDAGLRDTTMESGKWEMVHEVPTKSEALNFHPSSTTESNRFSPFGQTQGLYRIPRGEISPGAPSNDTRDWSDDEMECEWSMQLGGNQGSERPVRRPQNNGRMLGPIPFAISRTLRNRLLPRGIPKTARRDMPVNIDDIFGVGFRDAQQAPAGDHDSGDIVMPRTPLKHDHSGFDYGLWGGHSVENLNQSGRLDTPGSVANDYGFGEITMPKTPLKHDRGEFDYAMWGGHSFGSLDGANCPVPSGLDPYSVAGPSTSTPAPAAAAYVSGDLEMPKTPLKHDRGEFDYGLWGGHSVASFDQASSFTPVVSANSAQASAPSHHSDMFDVEPQPHGPAYDSGDVEMPRTPLKHARDSFDYGLWGSPARETRLAAANAYESGRTMIPRTPQNRSRGGVRAGRPTTSVDETSGREERSTSPGPVVDTSGLASTTRPEAPVSLRRLWRRRVGVRNLRAVAAAHAAMGDEQGLGLATSMLNNVLLAQRGDDALCNLSNLTSEEPVSPRSILPPLIGYHERSREYRERNGESDTSRTTSDSPSLLTPGASLFPTPGTSSFPTPGTSPCPTLTMEYYAGVAAGWEMMQNDKWKSGLQDEQSDMMVKPKWNMVANAMVVTGRKLRGLLWN